MIVLVTGASGQLGNDVTNYFVNQGANVLAPSSKELDITNINNIEEYTKYINLDIIVHCAAYTAVDAAENNIELNNIVNVEGTKNITNLAKKHNAKLIFTSTDYVFDGSKTGEYNELDIKKPINVYGKSKALAEDYIISEYEKYFILRISWVIGINGNNFVKTMIKLSEKHEELNIINDQVGSPTFTKDLSSLIYDMALTEKYGVYHVTNEGFCSWYEFANEIFNNLDIDIKLNKITSAEYPTAATRPLNSKMSKNKLIENDFRLLPCWKTSLKVYLQTLKGNEIND